MVKHSFLMGVRSNQVSRFLFLFGTQVSHLLLCWYVESNGKTVAFLVKGIRSQRILYHVFRITFVWSHIADKRTPYIRAKTHYFYAFNLITIIKVRKEIKRGWNYHFSKLYYDMSFSPSRLKDAIKTNSLVNYTPTIDVWGAEHWWMVTISIFTVKCNDGRVWCRHLIAICCSLFI